MKSNLKKTKVPFTWYNLIQMIGLLGIIFMVVNFFVHIVSNYWWILALVLYIFGMIKGATISKVLVLPKERMN